MTTIGAASPARHLIEAAADESLEAARDARDAASELRKQARKNKAAAAPQSAVASIIQQNSGPLVIVAFVMMGLALSLISYTLGTHSSTRENIGDLKDRVSLLETYNQQLLKRVTTLEAKEH